MRVPFWSRKRDIGWWWLRALDEQTIVERRMRRRNGASGKTVFRRAQPCRREMETGNEERRTENAAPDETMSFIRRRIAEKTPTLECVRQLIR
ncbi:hypothetical protein [Herbaspirillum robiniae]|uniref:hypothetical protein n=1 Tax=Herbaspirillum robiniae TaxID=2014887 RepID=UPI003D77D934